MTILDPKLINVDTIRRVELGADVLKNVSNFVAANPEAEKARLHKQIRSEADKVKKNGDLKQIEKVEKELETLT